MQRKKLAALPIPPMTTAVSLPPAVIKNKSGPYYDFKNYFYTASIDNSTGEDVLIIDLYATDGVHQWRYFLNKVGCYFRVMPDGKLSDAGMDHIMNWHMCYRSELFCEAQTIDVFKEFFKTKSLDKPFSYIASLNRTYKKELLEAKLNKIRESFDNAMLEIRPLPKAVDRWVDTTLLKHSRYMIYKYDRKNTVDAYCTYCATTSGVSHPKHKQSGVCPHCKSKVTYLSIGRLSKYTMQSDKSEFAYVQPTKQGFCLRHFYVYRNFIGPNVCLALTKIETHTCEISRIFYRYDDIPHQYKRDSSYAYEQFKNIYEMRFCREWVDTPRCAVYPRNLNQLLKRDGAFAHLDFDGIARYCGKLNLERLVSAARLYPALENLYKSRLYKLVEGVIESLTKFDWLDLSQRSARKALSLGISDIKVVCALNLSESQLDVYHYVKNHEGKVDVNVFKQLMDVGACHFGIKDILDYGTLHSVTRYLLEQTKHQDISTVMILWSDYLRFANELGDRYGYDFKNRNTIYPRKLKEAHDRASNDKIKYREQVLQKKFARISALYESYKALYGFDYKGLTVFPPRDYEELKQEGTKLHHCVANYAEKIADGKSVILFIRRIENPDEPYFTLELNPNTCKKIQCRGMKNCGYDKVIQAFLDAHYKKLIQRKSAKNKPIKSA